VEGPTIHQGFVPPTISVPHGDRRYECFCSSAERRVIGDAPRPAGQYFSQYDMRAIAALLPTHVQASGVFVSSHQIALLNDLVLHTNAVHQWTEALWRPPDPYAHFRDSMNHHHDPSEHKHLVTRS
jgi:hypothetical protein